MMFILSVFSRGLMAADLGHCLAQAASIEHRIDREESFKFCFNKNKSSTKRELCFQNVEQRKDVIASMTLTEQLKSICFYETSSFLNIKDCVQDSGKFSSASDHDEAVFYCYQMFQDKLTKQQCQKTAKKMIFPAKREYLIQHCSDVGD